MAVRHQLIERPPDAVWSVLEDGNRYADWVVGTSESRPVEGHWPRLGSKIEYKIRLGPRTVDGHTVVRRLERPHWLELEAFSPLGTARIAIEIRPWGEDTLVIVDEHPLRGPGGTAHNVAIDVLLQIRHRSMLGRLAEIVERTPRPVASDTRDLGPEM
ncbi:SRPBCC family protein [Streptomyces sp. AK02-01A]|uniref:SRPBCC family protein n=1 Tax=Streptomyces sp. AK02-01A TaxID=3028648 RepID=UPI0029A675B8|nr:SRPBCC family protein [Streptomyces sp. AK02-01A]MDX3850965.1 SRPBCC family protein [Streptomyces sp. AK02-01A]